MTSGYWDCSRTEPKRYDYLGATGYALSYARRRDKVTIVDVGCSTGVAMSECKRCIVRQGIGVHAIGIDMSGDVAARAKGELDEFILDDVLDVDSHQGDADVVMCLNVARFVTWDVRCRIVRKCAWFLNGDGMLITGIDKEHLKKTVLEKPSSRISGRVCREGGLAERVIDWMIRCDPKDTRMMSRSEALRYADMLMAEWRNMNPLKKRRIMIRIAYGRLTSITLPALRRRAVATIKGHLG